MTAIAAIGHNSPPDPIDDALAPYGDWITEAEAWLDGGAVETEGQMKSVDSLLRRIKAAEKAVGDARDEATKPLHAAWQAEIARWKPTLEDLARIKKGLIATLDVFKRKLVAEKVAAEARARQEADAKARAAARAASEASATDIEAQRAAVAAREAAELAQAKANAASKDTVKGLRTVTLYQISDHKKLLHWIAANDRDSITAFIEEWARKNHKPDPRADGLDVWQEKRAF